MKKLRALLATPPEPFLITARTHHRVESLIQQAGEGATIYNIGAGRTRLGKRVINIDIYDSGETDVLGSALALPIRSQTSDLIILQGVLEHVEDARQVLDECYRIMKPNSLLYTEMPFLQPYHQSPIDVCRSTQPGLERLCAPLVVVDSGIHIGPASSLAWMLREFLAGVISRGKQPLHGRVLSLVGWVVFPIKYADIVFERMPALHTIASSFYFLGRKVA